MIRKGIEMGNYIFMCSSSNEDCTDGDIGEMGINLSNEVKYKMKEIEEISRISFIGHSLGGLII